MHVPHLISDLALILGAAAVVTLLFKTIKQPVVLGYIIAGLLVGPHIKLFPTIVEMDSIRTWADIGVIFLLFGLGLEFSFRKLMAVGGVALITALCGVGLTITTGYFVGKFLGWSNMDCIFLGGLLSIASTTIIIRAFDELQVKTQKFTGVVTGVLVIEDLVAVVLMVVLSTLSITRTFVGTEMGFSILKLIFFLILWFTSGIFFLPTLLKGLRRLLSEETLLILALALCFLMVMLASLAGFSAPLGAFIMGSILAETTKAERIEHLLMPIKNLFGAIFFVSVGMLFDPVAVSEYYQPILLATLVLLFGKPLFAASGALLAGQPLRIAVQTGMTLSQIGEFSFIIATLGLTLNVTSAFLYPVAVAVSVLTTFTTPFMIRLSPVVYEGIQKVLPGNWVMRLNRYSVGTQIVAEQSEWKKLLRFYFITVLLHTVIILTLIFLSTEFILPYFSEYRASRSITAAVTLVLLCPFLWALAFRRMQPQAYAAVWLKPFQRGPLLLLMLSRIVLAVLLLGLFFRRLYTPEVAVACVVLASLLLVVFYKKLKAFYNRIELRFLSNLNDRDLQETSPVNALAPWDTHLATFEIESHSPYIGRTLQDSRIREEFGVNIAVIERGNAVINVPDRDQRIYPHDKVSVIGTDEQLQKFKKHLDASRVEPDLEPLKHSVTLEHFTISKTSRLVGKSIRNSGIRERTRGLVVGVERLGSRMLNPPSDFVFEEGDTIWIVGNEIRIMILARE